MEAAAKTAQCFTSLDLVTLSYSNFARINKSQISRLNTRRKPVFPLGTRFRLDRRMETGIAAGHALFAMPAGLSFQSKFKVTSPV